MNNKLSALLTGAIVTGLLASTAAKAEEAATTQNKGDEMSANKSGCKGEMKADAKAGAKAEKTGAKNECKGNKKAHKNKCAGKGACGEAAKDAAPKTEENAGK